MIMEVTDKIKGVGLEGIEALDFDTHGREPIFFDIETGPCEDYAFVKTLMPPFKAPSNYTDPDKILAAKEKKEAEWWDKAALDPISGEIVAFGWRHKGQSYYIDDAEDGGPGLEQLILIGIEKLAQVAGGRMWIGHNIVDFDLPFIVRRFWKYRMAMPAGWKQGRYWNNWFVDTQGLFGLGKYKDMISLDRLAKYLGHKTGKAGKSGDKFHELLNEDFDGAMSYLDGDLRLTEYCYEAIKH
jgi:hypothetical protein